MKKTTKIIAFVLALIIAASAFSVSGFAIAEELTAGSSKATAKNIPQFNVDYVSSLDTAGEADWFKFTTLSEDAYYTFHLENYNIHDNSPGENYSLNLYVFDVFDKKLVNVQGTGNTNIKLEKNTTYYLKVNMGAYFTNSTGNYAIRISYVLDPVSNIKEEATDIDINTTYKYSLDGTSDADWFKFTTTSAGKYKVTLENYNILDNSPSENYSLNLYIYDVYNKKLLNQQGKGSSEVTLEENVTYYVKVSMGDYFKTSTGNYGFSINCDSAPAAKSLSGITVKKLPSKTSYNVDESFDKTGLVINAEYSDGTSAPVTNYTLSGFDSTQAGNKTVTVKYIENGITKTATFTVTVNASSEEPDPDQNDGEDKGSFLAIFSAIGNFFVWIINLILGLIG